MIKPSELRIGNLVLREAKIKEIRKTAKHHVTIQDYQTKEKHSHRVSQNDLDPITLTEEWLLKFGFEKINNGWYQNEFQLYDYNYANKEKELDLQLNAVRCPLPKIKYVHQLQNLYFCLTGKELEIK